jgi:Putative abortive phage resistance protein AbiGi, antitoxin
MSEIISANTLFHFTTCEENLLSILKGGFYVRYSLEIFDNLVGNDLAEIVIPMTCFCDIPLSQVKNHVGKYGCYAIGLTKDWGISNCISPVHYLYPNASTSQILKSTIENLQSFFDIEENDDEQAEKLMEAIPKPAYQYIQKELTDHFTSLNERIQNLQALIGHLIRYLKPYEGKIFRNEQYSNNVVKFYDEREWRYVPSRELLQSLKIKDSYMAKFFKDKIRRRHINMRLAARIKLHFEPKDVRFIVVKRDSEIPNFLNQLNSIFEKQISSYDLRILATRIISLEQIVENI